MISNSDIKRVLAQGILVAFLVNTTGPIPARANEIILPNPGVMIHLSPPMNPPMLKGIKVHTDNPFRFDFILDKGDSPLVSLPPAGRAREGDLKEQSTKLIKYFLASLTIPEKDLWVNLSPYEKDRIIPQSFGLTEMGRDLLAEDYMLKQITASLIYPEDEIGKKFWKRIYEEAKKKYGTTNIPVNTFNKVWIVPEKAVVYENAKAGTAYVVEARLKVMLEQDYLSMSKHDVGAPLAGAQNNRAGARPAPTATVTDVNQIGSQIIREIVIPELTKEINEGQNFAQLRQVYNSLILATWYKKKIKDSILSHVYADRNKIAGVGIHDGVGAGSKPAHLRVGLEPTPTDVLDTNTIYQQYLQAFKKGVFNYIKEEVVETPLMASVPQQLIPRKYFSGGFNLGIHDEAMATIPMNSLNRREVLKTLAAGSAGLMLVTAGIAAPKTDVIKRKTTIENGRVFLVASKILDVDDIIRLIADEYYYDVQGIKQEDWKRLRSIFQQQNPKFERNSRVEIKLDCTGVYYQLRLIYFLKNSRKLGSALVNQEGVKVPIYYLMPKNQRLFSIGETLEIAPGEQAVVLNFSELISEMGKRPKKDIKQWRKILEDNLTLSLVHELTHALTNENIHKNVYSGVLRKNEVVRRMLTESGNSPHRAVQEFAAYLGAVAYGFPLETIERIRLDKKTYRFSAYATEAIMELMADKLHFSAGHFFREVLEKRRILNRELTDEEINGIKDNSNSYSQIKARLTEEELRKSLSVFIEGIDFYEMNKAALEIYQSFFGELRLKVPAIPSEIIDQALQGNEAMMSSKSSQESDPAMMQQKVILEMIRRWGVDGAMAVNRSEEADHHLGFVPAYLLKYRDGMINRLDPETRNVVNILIHGDHVIFAGEETPLWQGSASRSGEVWRGVSRLNQGFAPNRNLIFPKGLRVKGVGSARQRMIYVIHEGYSKVKVPLARVLWFGANGSSLRLEMFNALSLGYLWNKVWGPNQFPGVDLPVGINYVSTVPFKGSMISIADYFRILIKDHQSTGGLNLCRVVDVHRKRKQIKAWQVERLTNQQRDDYVKDFINIIEPAQMISINSSPLRAGTLDIISNRYDSPLDDFLRFSNPLYRAKPIQEKFKLGLRVVNEVLGQMILEYDPLRMLFPQKMYDERARKEPLEDIVLQTIFESMIQKALEKNQRQRLAAVKGYIKTISQTAGLLWAVGGQTGGESFREKDLAFDGNRTIIHDLDDAVVPNLDSKEFDLPGFLIGFRMDINALMRTIKVMAMALNMEENYPEGQLANELVKTLKESMRGSFNKIFDVPENEALIGQEYRNDFLNKVSRLSIEDLRRNYKVIERPNTGPSLSSDSRELYFELLTELKNLALAQLRKDEAMNVQANQAIDAAKGGIDLTPATSALQTQNAGESIQFHLNPAMLAQLQNAPGFTPVIINIQSMNDLPGFLGISSNTT